MIVARWPGLTWSTSDSCTFVFTRIGALKSSRLKIFCRFWTDEPTSNWGLPAFRLGSLARTMWPSKAAVDSAVGNLLAEHSFLALLEPPGCQLGQLVCPLVLDLDFKLFDCLLTGVFLEHFLLGLCLFECRTFALERLFGGFEAVFDLELGHHIGRGRCRTFHGQEILATESWTLRVRSSRALAF